jgi:hypothetical protein
MSRVLFEKLTVAQPVIKFPVIRNLKVQYRVHNSPLLNPIPSHMIPVHILQVYVF